MKSSVVQEADSSHARSAAAGYSAGSTMNHWEAAATFGAHAC